MATTTGLGAFSAAKVTSKDFDSVGLPKAPKSPTNDVFADRQEVDPPGEWATGRGGNRGPSFSWK